MGPASPHYKTGRYGKYLPERLRERYEEGLSDPELLELRSEIALLDARLGELLDSVDTGENRKRWDKLSRVWEKYCDAEEAGNVRDQKRLAASLDKLITRGHSEAQAWAEIQTTIELRRKVVTAENRRENEARQTITVEQAIALLGVALESLREAVERYAEPEVARYILVDASATYQRLLSADNE